MNSTILDYEDFVVFWLNGKMYGQIKGEEPREVIEVYSVDLSKPPYDNFSEEELLTLVEADITGEDLVDPIYRYFKYLEA